MAFLLGALGGAASGLIFTAVSDLMQDDTPDPAKVQAVKDAQAQMKDELVAGGMSKMDAAIQAQAATRSAMREAQAPVDNVTGKDYLQSAIAGAVGGATLGAFSKMASPAVRSASDKIKGMKVPSFLTKSGKSAPVASAPTAAAVPKSSVAPIKPKSAGLSDDALQAEIDDTVSSGRITATPKDAALAVRNAKDLSEHEHATTFLMEGAPSAFTPVKNVGRSAARARRTQTRESFEGKRNMDEKLRSSQMSNDFDKMEMLNDLFGGM